MAFNASNIQLTVIVTLPTIPAYGDYTTFDIGLYPCSGSPDTTFDPFIFSGIAYSFGTGSSSSPTQFQGLVECGVNATQPNPPITSINAFGPPATPTGTLVLSALASSSAAGTFSLAINGTTVASASGIKTCESDHFDSIALGGDLGNGTYTLVSVINLTTGEDITALNGCSPPPSNLFVQVQKLK